MPRNPRARTTRQAPAAILRHYRAVLRRYEKSDTEPASSLQIVSSRSRPRAYPSLPLKQPPYPKNSDEWEVLDPIDVREFFHYEFWLRAPAVVACYWAWQTNDLPLRREIGGLATRLLPDLIAGRHFSLLHKKDIRDATVTDLTLDLWEIFRQTEFVDVLRKQRWAFWTSHLQQRVITPILEEARALRLQQDEKLGPDLFVRIDVTAPRHKSLRRIEGLIDLRRHWLTRSPTRRARIDAVIRAARSERGRNYDPEVWCRRLVIWDLRHEHEGAASTPRTFGSLPHRFPPVTSAIKSISIPVVSG